jgi:methyl-accepting chemotaxis protein
MSENKDHHLNPQALRADYTLGVTLAILLLISIAIAYMNGSWAEALAIGIPAVAVPWTLIRILPTSLATRLSIASALMIFAGLFIQQTHGMSEAHFSVFILLAFTLYYRDWKPILAASVLIAVHHVAFNFLQVGNTGIYIFSQGASLKLLIIHALSVVFEAGILIFMSAALAKEAKMLGLEPSELAELANKISNGDLTNKFTVAEGDKTSVAYSIKVLQRTLDGLVH